MKSPVQVAMAPSSTSPTGSAGNASSIRQDVAAAIDPTMVPGQLFSNAATVPASVPAAALPKSAPVAKAVASTVTPDSAPVAKAVASTVAPDSSGGISAITENGLSQLNSALRAAGIDPDSLHIVGHDDQAYYPGGTWTNHLLTLTAGGHTESFMADLTASNPNVTVTEIKRLMTLA